MRNSYLAALFLSVISAVLILGGCERSKSLEEVVRRETLRQLDDAEREARLSLKRHQPGRAVTLLRTVLSNSLPMELKNDEEIRRKRFSAARDLLKLYVERRELGRAWRLCHEAEPWAETEREQKELTLMKLAVYVSQGDFDSFDALATRAAEKLEAPEEIQLTFNYLRAYRFFLSGDLMKAEQELAGMARSRAILLLSAEVLQFRASSDDVTEAFKILRSLIKSNAERLGPNPANNEVLGRTADILMEQGKPKPALIAINRALKNRVGDPVFNDINLLGLSGWGLSATGDSEGARDAFQEAREILPLFTSFDQHAEGLLDYYEGAGALDAGDADRGVGLLFLAEGKIIYPTLRSNASLRLGLALMKQDRDEEAEKALTSVYEWCGYCRNGLRAFDALSHLKEKKAAAAGGGPKTEE